MLLATGKPRHVEIGSKWKTKELGIAWNQGEAPGIEVGEAPDAFDVDVGVITTSTLEMANLDQGLRPNQDH